MKELRDLVWRFVAGFGLGMLGGELIFLLGVYLPEGTAWSWMPLIVSGVCLLLWSLSGFGLMLVRRRLGIPALAFAALVLGVVALRYVPKSPELFPYGLIWHWRWFSGICALLGAMVYVARGLWRRRRRIAGIALGVLAAILAIGFGRFLYWPGTWGRMHVSGDYDSRIRDPYVPESSRICAFESAYYGDRSGGRYPEIAPEWLTKPADGSFLGLKSEGLDSAVRQRELGFSMDSLPVRGITYVPDGSAPAPVVVIVHGSHPEHAPVYEGYGYLCRPLAEKGYIVLSVDENFLNDRWSGWIKRGEMEARGWLVLKHLEQLRRWNATPGHPLFGRADLSKVALVGHSRGGRAMSLAFKFNSMSGYSGPDGRYEKFDFGFGIRTVVGIASYDDYLFQGNRGPELTDVDYLAVFGSHDLDVYYPSALRTYFGVRFSPASGFHMKQAFCIYRATHAGFNSKCGYDLSFPLRLLVNNRNNLHPEDQRQATRVVVVNFIEASIRGNRRAIAEVRDYRLLGAGLPYNYYMSLAEFSDERIIEDFEEEDAPESNGKEIFVEEQVFKNVDRTPQGNRALRIKTEGDTLCYDFAIPDSLGLPSPGALAMDVYNHMARRPDFIVEAEFADGTVTRSRLSDYSSVPPRFEYHPEKVGISVLRFSRNYDEMGETIEIPAAFRLSDGSPLTRISVLVPPETDIAIDNIRFRGPRQQFPIPFRKPR